MQNHGAAVGINCGISSRAIPNYIKKKVEINYLEINYLISIAIP